MSWKQLEQNDCDLTYDPYQALAIQLIQTSVLEFRDTRKSRLGNRMQAREFLRGGKDSMMEFWCNVANVERTAIQSGLFVGKDLL